MIAQKQYYQWIDSVRAICMILVYYVHAQDFSGIHYSFDHGLISSIYVNAFFIVSGYLLFGKQLATPIISEDYHSFLANGWKNGVTNIIYRIALPTILFSAVLYVPKELIAKEPLTISGFLLQTIGGGTYWFTSALFVAELLILILLICRQKSIWFYLGICISVSFISMYLCAKVESLNVSRQPWSFMSGLLAVGLLSFGGLYKKYEAWLDKVLSKSLWLIVAMLVFCTAVYFYPSYFKFSISTHKVNILGYLWCVPLSIILFSACKKLPKSGVLSFLGKNSLCLYLLSGVTPRIGTILVKQFHMNNYFSLLLIILIAILISCVVIVVINRYFAFLLDFRKFNFKK